MSIGPFRRSVGALGLLMLVPLAAMLVAGALHPVEAAQRAVISLVVLIVLGRVAAWGMRQVATALERAEVPSQSAASVPAPEPGPQGDRR